MAACTQMLKYRPSARHDDGPKIFTGHPAEFKLWEFNTSMKAKLASADKNKSPQYVQEVMQSLGGEALQLAQDLGVEKLCAEDGIADLIKEMKTLTFPTFKQEASALYALGHEKGGILSRQTSQNEPIASYIERRTQWWKLMKEHDPSVAISDEIRGDQLLENSGLTGDQKTMIKGFYWQCDWF